jgi:hypothetical protein
MLDMRLPKERVRHLAHSLSEQLQAEGLVRVAGDKKGLADALAQSITDELQVEDRLNAEVRELLKAYADQIERGQVDYQKMFTMIKTKLARDRGLVL